MNQMDSRSFPQLLSELLASADEVASLAKDSETEPETFNEFAVFVEKFSPILNDLRINNKAMDTPQIRKAVESLETEIRRARTLIRNSNSRSPVKQIEDVTHDLGRCLGLVLLASLDVSAEIKQKIGALHKEMINAKFNTNVVVDRELELGAELEIKEEEEFELEEDRVVLDVDDVALQLKYGNDQEFKAALSGLSVLIRDKLVRNEWISDEGIIPILLNRLGSSKQCNRLTIILLLRRLAHLKEENKEKMADLGSLSTLVRSLSRDIEESREAVGLLLELSELQAVRRRIGRIQGCIVMLVALRNGEEPCASHDAGKLLNSLSTNTQNVLHMAEAGYFKPLVQYLKEGSDMSKILMATALSRMELTDQSRASLGEEGAIEPLVKMFSSGKLEAKLSALGALQNLSRLTQNVKHLVRSGIVASLLQLLFSVTSVLMTLREPASAILASIAQSDSVLVNQDVAQKMLSLLSLSSPVIQYHLLRALNSIVIHSSASKVRSRMKENGAIQLLLPFLTERSTEIRTVALNVLNNLTKDLPKELTEELGEFHLNIIVNIISESISEDEKAAALALLSNIPVSDKKATDILKKAHLLPILISLMGTCTTTSASTSKWMEESIAGILIRFTIPSDKKLQLLSAEQGVIPLLVKLLSTGSPVAKCRAATSLAQLSHNSSSLSKSRTSRWLCVPPSVEAFCEVHDGYCFVKNTFCLIKSGAIPFLLQSLEGQDREADEAILGALSTLMQNETWESGSKVIVKASGVQAILRVLEVGNVKSQEKALWMLERIFRIQAHRVQYGEPSQALLIDLAQKGAPTLKSTIAKILAHLELLQVQSSYF
ncbi:PREDICTED: U-box domain-containing protein 44-like isoform X2 [Nelumbo nucifera]|uniref:U-box domain-containing protein 44-like n=2 Tax=Nelumbo nucifera TaxID=4432 RepID=A0A822Z8A6_NELNU|nr:PREDICTED: U-box domain-containing protein 44-like isoform X2 [Nelumbo nucifera]DAD42604.1 TPA_asm: hypothetical protein HUJ06_000834 [Nelumbo nucifera]